MPDDRLALSLQENLLTLMAFHEPSAPIIRNSVPVELFGNPLYRKVVTHVYDHWDRYKKPPGDHLPDLLEVDLMAGTNEAGMLADLLDALFNNKDRVTPQYALDQLETFIRQQTLKGSIINASEAVQEGKLDEAEAILAEASKTRLSVFNPGSTLLDGLRKAYTHDVRQNVLPLGIKELDEWDLGPAAGELHEYISGPKTGKSWWLCHIAKRCLLHRMRCLYVTLELSEAQIEQRILQSLFSATRRKQKVPVTRLRTDDLGRLLRFEPDTIQGRPSFDDLSSRPGLEKKLARLHPADNLLVKQFPAGQLTVRTLTAFLDNLEQQYNFIPQVLVLDYPKYMKINPDNYRIESGMLLDQLRGLAVSRHMAICAAKESNREGQKTRMVTSMHSGEDYSVAYTADTVLTYTQTLQERALGLARLYVDSTRVAERDKFVVLLSQSYPIGQYCLSSAPMANNYLGLLELASANAPGAQKEDSEEE